MWYNNTVKEIFKRKPTVFAVKAEYNYEKKKHFGVDRLTCRHNALRLVHQNESKGTVQRILAQGYEHPFSHRFRNAYL